MLNVRYNGALKIAKQCIVLYTQAAIHKSVLYFSKSPHIACGSDQSFCRVDSDTAEEKSALGTAPAQSCLRHLSNCRLCFPAVI